MPEVHLRTVDLNLLHALRALLEERHVTRAAERCFLSQPAMSRALERLREMFGDVLLVRHGRVYERTVRGERVLRELEWLMPRLEAMVRGEPFDPARSQERFRVAMTDYAFTVLMPVLAERVRATAPTVRIAACEWREENFDELVAGRIDVALSPLGAPPGLEAAMLFREDFVCLVGSKRRVRTRRFTIRQYLDLPHAVVDVLAGQQPPVDRPLTELGVQRHVALTMPFFVPSILAIARTDLVLTLPRRLVKITRAMAPLQMVEPPQEITGFPYFMVWHLRLTSDPAHAWFREQLRWAVRAI